jgi:hypothetical protein
VYKILAELPNAFGTAIVMVTHDGAAVKLGTTSLHCGTGSCRRSLTRAAVRLVWALDVRHLVRPSDPLALSAPGLRLRFRPGVAFT